MQCSHLKEQGIFIYFNLELLLRYIKRKMQNSAQNITICKTRIPQSTVCLSREKGVCLEDFDLGKNTHIFSKEHLFLYTHFGLDLHMFVCAWKSRVGIRNRLFIYFFVLFKIILDFLFVYLGTIKFFTSSFFV